MSDSAPVVEIFSSIQGEGALLGVRQIFVRLHGCRLGCAYCDTVAGSETAPCRIETTPGSGTFAETGNPLTVAAIVGVVGEWRRLKPGVHHSVSITGGEPLEHAPFLRNLLPSVRELLPVFLETNGVHHDELLSVLPFIDFISADIKLPSVTGLPPTFEAHRKFLREAVSRQLIVKVVVGAETDDVEVEEAAAVTAAAGRDVPFVLQPLTLPGPRVAVPAPRLLRLQEVASRHLTNVRIIPQTHRFMNIL